MTTLLSYSPAIASLIARISLRENTKDVSFRLRGDWSAKSVADRLVLACVFRIEDVWSRMDTGLMRFAWTSVGREYGTWGPENFDRHFDRRNARIASVWASTGRASIFSIPACVQSFGEEVGWRGYLLTRLFDAKVPAPIFWNGLIWGLWHVPFFLAWVPSRSLRSEGQSQFSSLWLALLFWHISSATFGCGRGASGQQCSRTHQGTQYSFLRSTDSLWRVPSGREN